MVSGGAYVSSPLEKGDREKAVDEVALLFYKSITTIRKEYIMKLTGNLKKQVEKAETKDEEIRDA